MYFVFKDELSSWHNQTVQARILGKLPQLTPHWWKGKSLTKPLHVLTFSVNPIAPKPDNFFTGTIFNLYSRRLINLLNEAGIRHEIFPAKLINRKTQETLSIQYDVFHLLEIHPGVDKKFSNIDDELLEIRKLVLTKDCIKAKWQFFRLKETPEIVVIHKDLKNIFDSYGITGCKYTPIEEFQTGVHFYFENMKKQISKN